MKVIRKRDRKNHTALKLLLALIFAAAELADMSPGKVRSPPK